MFIYLFSDIPILTMRSKKTDKESKKTTTSAKASSSSSTSRKPLTKLTFEHISIYSATCIYKFFDGPMDKELKKMITNKDNVELKEAYIFYLKHKQDLKTFFDLGEHLLEKIPPTTLWKNWVTIGPPEPLIEFQITEEMQRNVRELRKKNFFFSKHYAVFITFLDPDKIKKWVRKNQPRNPRLLLQRTTRLK